MATSLVPKIGAVGTLAQLSTDASGNTVLVGADGLDIGIGAQAPKPQLTAIVIGNSIAAQSKHTGTYWQMKSEIHHANALAGDPLRFKRMTATTRMDLWGVYGYSSQELSTINTDLGDQVWAQLRTSSVIPDIIIGHSLIENDIGNGVATATIQARVTQFIRDAQGRYPGAIIALGTPRPSFSNNTASKVLTYQDMRTWMLALDNGSSIFVANLSGYENPDSPATPLGTSGSPIWTDSSVHPNAKGAVKLARAWAAMLRRISYVWKPEFVANSANMALGGTGAASGTNVSGTVPTGTSGFGSANATSFVLTAEQPGLLAVITVPVSAGPAPADIGNGVLGSTSLVANSFSPFLEVEIVSGAENLHSVELNPRVADASGSPFIKYIENQTGDAQPDWEDGDVLFLRSPPIVPVTAPMSACTVYLNTRLKYQGGTVTLRVKRQGVGIVS